MSLSAAKIDEIKHAAARIFAEKGYHNTSVSDITESVEIARGTFYHRFSSKQDIFEQILKDTFEQLDVAIQPIRLGEGEPPILRQLRDNFTRIFRVLAENPAVVYTYLNYSRLSGEIDAEVSEQLAEFDSKLISMVQASLEVGMQLNLVRQTNARHAALLLVGGLANFFAHHPIETPTAAQDNLAVNQQEKTIDEILDFYLKGLMY